MSDVREIVVRMGRWLETGHGREQAIRRFEEASSRRCVCASYRGGEETSSHRVTGYKVGVRLTKEQNVDP